MQEERESDLANDGMAANLWYCVEDS